MKIHLEYRNPTPIHCEVVVFINGANCGRLTLRQEEIVGFQQILSAGCAKGIDTFVSSGNPNVEDAPVFDPTARMRVKGAVGFRKEREER